MRFRSCVLAAVAMLAGVASAAAADWPGGRPDAAAEALIPQEVGTGWYIRGDIAYDFQKRPDSRWDLGPLDRARLDDGWGIGVGFGYQWTEWLRFDVTADIRDSRAFSAASYDRTHPFTLAVEPGRERSTLRASTVLVNGYIDLPFHDRITPYIGAGIGGAFLSVGPHRAIAVSDGAEMARYDKRNEWTFAWALMGGVAYHIAPSVSIDLGYRYLALGDVSTGADRHGNGKVEYSGLATHEVRAGVRWVLD